MSSALKRGGVCRHCDKRCRRLYPRGVCHRCYVDPVVRELYPTACPVGHGTENRVGVAPPAPTAHLPGDPGKVAAMEARVALGYSAFHPKDARRTL